MLLRRTHRTGMIIPLLELVALVHLTSPSVEPSCGRAPAPRLCPPQRTAGEYCWRLRETAHRWLLARVAATSEGYPGSSASSPRKASSGMAILSPGDRALGEHDDAVAARDAREVLRRLDDRLPVALGVDPTEDRGRRRRVERPASTNASCAASKSWRPAARATKASQLRRERRRSKGRRRWIRDPG